MISKRKVVYFPPLRHHNTYLDMCSLLSEYVRKGGIVVIPGSSNPEHIRENLDLFGFELSDEEMEQIAALDRGEKHDWH